MKLRTLLTFLSVGLLLASGAQAALSKYEIRYTIVTENQGQSPRPEIFTNYPPGPAVVDNDGGSGTPILKKLQIITGGLGGVTISAPGFSGFIFLRTGTVENPAPDQVGTGDISNSVNWGDTDGWTVTGGQFCHSVPATLCDLANRQDSDTVMPILISTHYEMFPWNFHGTGFVAVPYVFYTNKEFIGNSQRFIRGVNDPGGEVPALPLLAVAGVAASIVGMGIAAIRRR